MRLLLAQLSIPSDLVELNILHKETHTSECLVKNPNGKIPTVELDDGRCLSEFNAILFYFSQGTDY